MEKMEASDWSRAMDDVISFPVWETTDQWVKEDRGLIRTGSHVI